MSITEGTQPAALQWTGAWTTNQTTASFTPESGALLVALVAGDGAANGALTATVTDSLSGTWTLLKRQNAGSAVLGGLAEVWCRDSPGSALTVSVKNNNELGVGSTGGQLVVRTLIGALATASQNGATGGASPASAAVQVSVAAGTGNKIYGAALNYDNSTVMTVLGNTTAISQFSDTTNGDTWEAFKSSGDTAGTATYGYSTSHNGMIAAAEIKASAAAAAPPAAFNALPGRTWLRHFRHPQFLPQPSPAVVTAGAAALDGNGTLTAAPYFDPSPVAMSGSGSLSAGPFFAGIAALSGTGTLSAVPGAPGTATLSGSGTLTAAPQLAGTVTLSGSGTLSATYTSSGAPPGPVVIQAQPQPVPRPPPLGSQILGAAPVVTYTEGAALSGTGTLTAAPAFTPAAALSGTGTLTAAPVIGTTGTLSGSGTLTAAPVQLTTAALSGSGTLTNVSVGIGVHLTGSGTLSAFLGAGVANLSGSGALTAAPAFTPAAALAGLGTLSAVRVLGFQGAAALSGQGTLTGNWALVLQAALSGTGALTGAGSQHVPFTVGTLTATDVPGGSSGAVLTASDTRTGGPS